MCEKHGYASPHTKEAETSGRQVVPSCLNLQCSAMVFKVYSQEAKEGRNWHLLDPHRDVGVQHEQKKRHSINPALKLQSASRTVLFSLIFRVKGIVQRILRGVDTKLIICTGKLEARLFFFLIFKGTPSQEEHKTVFSSLKFCKMALSNQTDFPAFFHLQKMTYRKFINSGI